MRTPIALPYQPWLDYKQRSENWEAEMNRRGCTNIMGCGIKAARARWEARQKKIIGVNGKLVEIWIDPKFMKNNPL